MAISSLKGDGMDAWCDWLLEKVEEKKQSMVAA
jgi:hydrogenase nickel incorporation protein HypB